jgi:Zn-dependent protease with chaperone function
MRVAVYLPLFASLIFTFGWPALAARRLPPVVGAWTVTAGAVLCAAGTVWSLALLSATLLDDVLPDRHPGLDVVSAPDPVNDLVGLAALGLLVAGCARLVRELHARHAIHRDLRRLCTGGEAGLVVLADRAPRAFAVPGQGGHIVVSSGMLAALSMAERRVLIAHERTHLAARHHWHTGVVRAAAILDPLLIGLDATSRYLCERWADENAARTVGDRRLAATSLARAALAAADTPLPPAALAYHGTGIGARVAALQAPPAPPRHAVIVALLGLVGLMLASDVHATGDFLRMMVPFLRQVA